MIHLPDVQKCFCGEPLFKRVFLPTSPNFIGTPDYKEEPIYHDCKFNKKSKTAMQKLIDYMRANFHLTESAEFEFEDSLLAEKEQIENTYDKGFSFGVAMLKQKQEVFVNGEKYYNQKFDNSDVS